MLLHNLRRTTAVLALAGIALALVPGSAQADRGPVGQAKPTTSITFRPGQGDVLVAAAKLENLAAGESRRLHGRLEAVSSTTTVVAMNATIRCFADEARTQQIGVVSTSSRNHEGSDAPYAVTGHLPLLVDKLFTAPSAGTFHCGLFGRTDSTSNSDYNLAVVTGGKSYLEYSLQDQPGAGWWDSLPCDSQGTAATCTYIGTSTKTDTFTFYDDGSTVQKWAYAPGTTAVQALANVTVTTCYQGTASCKGVPAADQLPRTANSYTAATFRMDVIQLKTDNSHACKTTSTTPVTNKIRDDAHHYTANLSLASVPVDPACGNLFLLRVYIKHVSGSPLKIDGHQNSTSLANGIMMNL
ncbi:hypothetical protein [Actinoplanes siamensis]|uniref:Tat pathway signal sequence domain protein n=1 Tax=Actinoplanes siamensis TaxID=1223317 RepID=A0A919N6U5_9ACTN|nr:hypothetical protein [Actinoplanes siamensis]GIF05487.1 hypothetical protein Asi03nite_30250 [Actinoplanes siamensis]